MDQPTAIEPGEAPPPGALQELARDPSSRKRFLRMVGGTGAAGALATLLAACGEGEVKPPTRPMPNQASGSRFGEGDVGVLNFALTLEHIETDFYDQVVESRLLKGRAGDLVKRIRENEHEHVDTVTTTVERMGGKPAEKPKTKFDDILAEGRRKVLLTASEIENTGVAAYLGQADKIQDKDVLAAALSIHTVEARQAAALNEVAGHSFQGETEAMGTLPTGAFGKPMEIDAVLQAVKPFMAA